MTEEEKNDLIEAYLSGRSTQEQARQVDRLRKEDPAFQMEFEEQQVLWQALGPSKINAFRSIASDVLAEQSSERKNIRSFSISRRTIAIAAALVVLLVAAWWVFKPVGDPGEKLFARYFSMPSAPAFFRDPAADPAMDQLMEGQRLIDSLYRSGDYQEALNQMEAFGDQFSNARSSEFYFLLGLLHLSTDHTEAALQAFSQVEIGHPYDKGWYAGLAYLKTGNYTQAKAAFSDLAQSENPYRDDAYAILDALPE